MHGGAFRPGSPGPFNWSVGSYRAMKSAKTITKSRNPISDQSDTRGPMGEDVTQRLSLSMQASMRWLGRCVRDRPLWAWLDRRNLAHDSRTRGSTKAYETSTIRFTKT